MSPAIPPLRGPFGRALGWAWIAVLASLTGLAEGGHWAYERPRAAAIPPVRLLEWPDTAIDHFILARIEEHGMVPSRDADRATLCRRLHFDLTGLPPTLEDLDAFERDRRPDALARLVDRLLASPRFAEHWARHWFDVVRFGESVTLRGFIFKEAWRYRDYVIEAFGSDAPIDDFLRTQIAGDLLPWDSREQRWRQLVATTFLMLGNTNLEEQDKRQLEMDFVDEQLDVIGKAFLGQTLACARCHDHKFDPIPTRDYYALAGILKNLDCLKHDNVSAWVEQRLPVEPEVARELEEHDRAVAAAAEVLKSAREQLKLAQTGREQSGVAPDGKGAERGDREGLSRRVKQLEDELKRLRAAGPHWPMVMAPRETTNVVDLAVHRRGSVHSLGPVVPRGFPHFGGPMLEKGTAPGSKESGRRELADWLVSRSNPLTARVFVNRVWLWMMGDGLVRSPDNFGTTGDLPTHRELLDHLALQFAGAAPESGGGRIRPWSVKSLIREIALSRVYRLSGEGELAAMKADPENQWWARRRSKRLSAEQLRDAILMVGSGLNFQVPAGPTFPLDRPADYDFVSDRPLRSVYLPVFRNALPAIYDAFDFPQASMVTGRREESVVPSQSLFLFNDAFVRDQATAAGRVWAGESRGGPVIGRAAMAVRTLLGRAPAPGELHLAAEHFAVQGDTPVAWTEYLHALIASADFQWLR